MKLFAKVTEPDLLFKIIHEAGLCAYRLLGGGIVEVIYFSGNRQAYFKGKLDGDKMDILKANGWEVNKIEIDETSETVKIEQDGS